MTSLETQPRKRAGVIGERAKLVIFYSPTSGSCRRAEGYLADAREDRVSLTRQGLLLVDMLLPRFFLPHHAGIRYT